METANPTPIPGNSTRRIELPPWIKIAPTRHQLAFLLLDEEEAFYGGAGGGGKTIALLMAALQYAHVPGYAAVIFRRTYPQLTMQGGLVERGREILSGSGATWNEAKKIITFPGGGTLAFRHMESAQTHHEYSGLEAQFIAFDELTEFSEAQYRFMFSRLRRREGVNVPLRMRAASNPGGPGHDWVRQRFVVEGKLAGRPWVRSRIADNPHLDRESYMRTLDQLDPVTRSQILNGDWSARPQGGFFRREWFKIVEAVPKDCRFVRAWDFAGTEPKAGADPDWTVGLKLGRSSDGLLWIVDVRRLRGTSLAVDAALKQCAALDGRACRIDIPQDPGSAGKDVASRIVREVLQGYAVRATRPTGDKAVRAGPVASQAEAGNIRILSAPWTGALLDELDAFPAGSHDDQIDALSSAFARITAPSLSIAVI